MRVLFINANRFKLPWPVMPFGMCCVASAVEKAGYDVKILDLCFAKDPAREIETAVETYTPDVVGVSIRNIDNSAGYNTRFLLEDVSHDVIGPLRRAFGGPVVIGGPSVGINGEEMLAYFDLEYAIRGDGERGMVEFLDRIKAGKGWHGVPGLVVRKEGAIVEINEPARATDLNALPFARTYHWIDIRKYIAYGSPLQIQTKRGCALSCAYCTYNRIEGAGWRLRNPERVADEVAEIVRETGVRRIEFTDSTFNMPLRHAKAVLRAILARGLGELTLRTMGLNPGVVDEELVVLMKQAGFSEVDVGAESCSNKTLGGLGKNFRMGAIEKTGALFRRHGIPVVWYLLVGGPGESPETLEETFENIDRIAAPWDLVNVGVGLRVYKGSPVAEEVIDGTEDGFLRPVAYEPKDIRLDEVKMRVKEHALSRTNYFMYDEDEEKTPPWLMKVAARILGAISPRQPLWRLFIALRKAQTISGVNALKRFVFRRSVRNALDGIRRDSRETVSCGGVIMRTDIRVETRVGVETLPPSSRISQAFRAVSGSAGETIPSTRLTQVLRAVENRTASENAGWRSGFADGRYRIRVANDLASRRKAYRLLYRLYLEKGYAQRNPSELWVSAFDAVPETTTLYVERNSDGAAVGALTVIPDSPVGLPSDSLYKTENDILRVSGRRLCEFASLGVAEGIEESQAVLVELYSCASILAREVLGATDIMITVNPRHVGFYKRTLLFEDAGPERSYGKVGGAPAVLLRLDFDVQRESIWKLASSESSQSSRILYRFFHPLEQDPVVAEWLRDSLRPMTNQEINHFGLSKTPAVVAG
ncbi:MAG: radical SAM protein [Planctomycetota bacterium]